MNATCAPANPLYELGALPPIPRMQQTVQAPKIPMNQLGWLGADPAQIVGASAPIAATGTTMATAAAAGSWAGPIGAGVGVLVGIIAGLWAGHEARSKGATNENTLMNSAVQAFDASLKAIFAAANSTDPSRTITADQAIAACQQILQNYWQGVAHPAWPGTADSSNGGASCVVGKCDKQCTAACCVGCSDIAPAVQSAIAVFQAGGGTATIPQVTGSKYGGQLRSAYTLTYTPPPPSITSTLTSEVTSALNPSTPGFSLTPLLAIAAGLWLVTEL